MPLSTAPRAIASFPESSTLVATALSIAMFPALVYIFRHFYRQIINVIYCSTEIHIVKRKVRAGPAGVSRPGGRRPRARGRTRRGSVGPAVGLALGSIACQPTLERPVQRSGWRPPPAVGSNPGTTARRPPQAIPGAAI